MPYEDDYKMWLEKMLIESNPDWVCDEMYDKEITRNWCVDYCGEDDEYITPKCLHMYYHHIAKADRKTEPNLILPERMERGERYEVGETIVVMNRDDYYDLLCKSWKDESHTDTHDEAIKAMATLIKAKTEPQTDWHYDEQDATWYPYKHEDEPQTDCSWK